MTVTGVPASYGVTDLAQLPRLGGLFAKGLAGSAGKRPRGAVRLPTTAYQVVGVDTADEAAHLAAYQRLLGEPSSEVLPAGFLHVLAFPLATAVMVRGDFPLPLPGLVHLRNVARVLRPVRLGETLDVRAWAQSARAHRRGVQVDLVAEVLVDGVLAYQGTSTYLAKGFTAPDDAPAAESEPGAAAGADGPAAAEASTPAAAEAPREDWTPPLPTARWTLGGGTGRAYGAVSGDVNPIHTSSLGARAFGYPRAIAHGMYTAARALAEVGPARRGETYEWTVEFFKPVLLPSTVDVAIRYGEDIEGASPDPAVPTGATNRTRSIGGAGFVYDGWRSGKDTCHFRGTVTPL